MSDDSFVAPEEDVLVVRKVTSATFMKAKVIEEDEPIDLGDFSDDELPSQTHGEQKAGEGLEGTGLLTTADPYPAPETLQSNGNFKKAVAAPLVIPVVNSSTIDPVKYDLDRLMDPKIQKLAVTGDRFSAPHQAPPPRKQRDPNEPDFLKLNSASAAQPGVRPSYSYGGREERHSHYPDPVNVQGRFYDYMKRVAEKVKKLEEELTRKEKAQCTFEPEILEKRKDNEAPRSAEAFFQDQMLHKKLVNTKVEVLRQKADEAFSQAERKFYAPQLCEQSMKLLAAKPQDTQPRHDQLYQQHRKQMKQHVRNSDLSPSLDDSDLSSTSQSSARPFTPAINKASQRIVRDKPVEVYLMEDAARRQKARSAVPLQEAPVSLVTSASQLLLLKRFKEEFGVAWTEVSETDEINYSKVGELLKTLKFIDNQSAAGGYLAERELVRSIWPLLHLEDESSVSKRNIETLLCAVMAFPQAETAPAASPLAEESAEKESEQSKAPSPGFGRVEEGVLLLGLGDTKKIHRFYKSWYDHRAAATAKSTLNPTFKSPVEYSYQPQLSKGSARLSEAHMGSLAAKGYQQHYDYLADEGSVKAKRIQELAGKFEAATMKECAFQPATDKHSKKLLAQVEERESEGLAQDYFRLLRSSDGQPREKTAVLYELATLAGQRRGKLAKTSAERDLEKNAAECIFEPETVVPLGTIKADLAVRQLPARGVDKTVERLLKARQDFEALQARRERGLTNQDAPVPQRLQSAEPEAILSVQVNGRPEELRVHAEDDFETALKAFAAQHRLGEEDLTGVQEQMKLQYRTAFGKDPE